MKISTKERKRRSEVMIKRNLENNPMNNYEYRKKVSDSHKGMKHSNETKILITKQLKTRYDSGWINPMTGKKMSDVAKQKQRETWRKKINFGYISPHKGRSVSPLKRRKMKYDGSANPNWKGGISKYPYPFEYNEALKEKIRKRDNYTCQICKRQQIGKFDIHHIDYDANNCREENLIFLCCGCHAKTNVDRKIWEQVLKEYQEVRFSN